jgi:hypothetical protein
MASRATGGLAIQVSVPSTHPLRTVEHLCPVQDRISVSVLPAYILRHGNNTLPKEAVEALAGKPHHPGVQTRGHQPQCVASRRTSRIMLMGHRDIEFHLTPCVCKSGGRKTRSQCRPYDLKSAGPVEKIFLFNLISSGMYLSISMAPFTCPSYVLLEMR